jgi:two-component system response regulator
MLLFAEDDNEDWLLIEEALQECGQDRYERVCNGEQLLHRLQNGNPPHLVILDIRMPRMGGFEALDKIKKDPMLRHIPVMVMTTSRADLDITRSYASGANSYFIKPTTFPLMKALLGQARDYWVELVEMPTTGPWLEETA